MLAPLDTILHLEDCEVVEIPPYNQFIFLIYKNGSTSVTKEAGKNNYKIFTNQDIKELSKIDVYLRDPEERYLSGVNTFVQHLERDYPDIDSSTALWFALNYNFLNVHYMPQWHWLINLQKYCNKDCKFKLHNIKNLYQITNERDKSCVNPPADWFLNQYQKQKQNLSIWHLFDNIMLDLEGSELSWQQLTNYFKSHPSGAWDIINKQYETIAKQL